MTDITKLPNEISAKLDEMRNLIAREAILRLELDTIYGEDDFDVYFNLMSHFTTGAMDHAFIVEGTDFQRKQGMHLAQLHADLISLILEAHYRGAAQH